jgi:hypothetical protein
MVLKVISQTNIFAFSAKNKNKNELKTIGIKFDIE